MNAAVGNSTEQKLNGKSRSLHGATHGVATRRGGGGSRSERTQALPSCGWPTAGPRRQSGARAPVDEVARVLELFDTRYWDFTAKHFHEKLVADHGFKRSYNWLRLSLQAHGRRRAAPRRGAHRRKRPRRALPGMMLHQDGSSHEWVPGRWWDLIVTMDDATSDIYSAFFVAEEGTMSSFQGVSEAIRAKGLFCSLYADRASHYWNTPEAGGKVDKDTPTQVGRALAQLGIELIPAYSPEARGRSERMFGTLQKRLPQELRLAGITDMVEANRFLKEVFLPQHNARFATPAEDRGTAFVPFTGALDDILCIHEERTVSNDNTVRYKRLALQIPAGRHRAITSRPGSASTNTPTAQWPSSMDRDVWRDTTPMANRSTAKPARPRDPLRATAGALWTRPSHGPVQKDRTLPGGHDAGIMPCRTA